MLDLYTNIKNERLKNGWTQTDLAKRVGYSDKSMIAKIEAGKVDLPQTKIRAFAQVFNCTESYLMGWNDEDSDQDDEIILSDQEQKLIKAFRTMNDSMKRQIVLMAAYWSEHGDIE